MCRTEKVKKIARNGTCRTLRATGFSPKALHNYLTRQPTAAYISSAGSGKGARRSFSSKDAMLLGAMASITEIGIPANIAVVLAAEVVDWATTPYALAFSLHEGAESVALTRERLVFVPGKPVVEHDKMISNHSIQSRSS